MCCCVCGRKQQEQFISDSSSPATLQLFYSEMQFIYQHFAHIKMPQIVQRPLKHPAFFHKSDLRTVPGEPHQLLVGLSFLTCCKQQEKTLQESSQFALARRAT